MSEPIFYKSIDELKIMYEEKSISPLEVTEDLLKRIKKHNNKLNAYLEIYNDDAINCARSLDNSKSLSNTGKETEEFMLNFIFFTKSIKP